jgi:hypothetical protein
VTQHNPIVVVNGAVQRRHPYARKSAGDLGGPELRGAFDPSYVCRRLDVSRRCIRYPRRRRYLFMLNKRIAKEFVVGQGALQGPPRAALFEGWEKYRTRKQAARTRLV